MRRVRHWLAHRLGWNRGNPETWWANGRLWVGFHCYGCGRFQGVEDITERTMPSPARAAASRGREGEDR